HHLLGEIEIAERQQAMPRRLDLRLNGRCNLECIMCDVWRQPNELYDNSDLWTLGPEKIFPFLLEVDMLGGEPFIQRDTYRFIDFCAERDIQPIFQSVIGMPDLSLDSLTRAERQDVLAQLRPIAEGGRGYAVMPVLTALEASLERDR